MAPDADRAGLRAVVSIDGRVTAAVGDEVVEFVLARRDPCLSETDAWCSAVESLRTWAAAGLDPGLLRRHGLPVWCAPHRAERSPGPCGRLDAREPG